MRFTNTLFGYNIGTIIVRMLGYNIETNTNTTKVLTKPNVTAQPG